MKRINLISALAIAAMAALSLSCQKEGDMASKTREVSFGKNRSPSQQTSF